MSSADGTKLAAAAGGILYTSTNSGGTWSGSQPETGWQGAFAEGLPLAMSADGATLLMLTSQSAGGGIYVSTNTGSSWILATNVNTAWANVVCSANGTKIAALTSGLKNTVYLSTNSGVSWQTNLSFQTPEPGLGWMASTCDGDKLLVEAAGETNDEFYRSTNWGQTWSRPSLNLWIIGGSADDSVVYGFFPGHADGIYTSTNFGVTAVLNNAPPLAWYAIASSADGKKLFAAAGPAFNSGPTSTNGIWTLQLPPAPQLDFSSSSGAVNFSWLAPSTNMVLEESPDLDSWAVLTNVPSLDFANLREQLTLSATNGRAFFRLISQ